MFIKSFLLFTQDSKANDVSFQLNKRKGVESWPSDNKDVVVMVTDFQDQKSENELLEDLKNIREILSVSLVSAYS